MKDHHSIAAHIYAHDARSAQLSCTSSVRTVDRSTYNPALSYLERSAYSDNVFLHQQWGGDGQEGSAYLLWILRELVAESACKRAMIQAGAITILSKLLGDM